MRLLALLACFLLSWTAPAQSPSIDQALKDFSAEVHKQRLVLQDFSSDPVTNFAWTANGLSNTPPKMRTLGVFTLSSAKLHNDSIELSGRRSTFLKDESGKPALIGDAAVMIKIALNGVDPIQVLPALKSQLFFSSLDAAIVAIPPEYRKILLPTGEPPQKGQARPPNCPVDARYERPKIISTPEAEMSDEARRIRFSGFVSIIITVGEDGHPYDLWLGKPAALGLDEEAIKAVSGYIFKPATCDGMPVKTTLRIDVNFTMP